MISTRPRRFAPAFCRALAAGVLSLAAFGAHAAGAEWKPERNVEIVVGSAAGSSQDRTGRTLQRIMQERQLAAASVSVVNKPGGGSAIGWAYLNQHPGDAHYLAVSAPLLLTNNITGTNPLTYTDITPIAQLFSEYAVFVVRPDSPLKSGRELIERLRRDPASVTIGVSGNRGNALHIAIALAGRSAGVDVRRYKIAIFKGGGEVMTALLGGHVDVVPTSASNTLQHLQAGRMRALAVSAPRRMRGVLATAPTWREQGLNAVFANWRGVIGPRGLSAAQIAYWDEIFARLVETDEWKKDLERDLWKPNYLNSAESAKYLKAQYDELKAILAELGLAKQ